MNWTHFLLWLAGLYGLYYIAIILLDLTGGKQTGALKLATNELTFSEDIVPHEAEHLLANAQVINAATAAPEIIASGGVLLKDVYSLARKEVIVYTRQVSFQ